MAANNPIQRLEAKLRQRAWVALISACLLAIVAAGPLFMLLLAGFGTLLASRDATLIELIFGTIVYGLCLAPAALGFAQLNFYTKRRHGPGGRGALFWWGSAFVLNLSVTLLVGLVTLAGAAAAAFVAVPMLALTYQSWVAFHEERDLAQHRRWRDIVGDNIHVPIA